MAYTYTLKMLCDQGRAPRGVWVKSPDGKGMISYVTEVGAYLEGKDLPYDPASLIVLPHSEWGN